MKSSSVTKRRELRSYTRLRARLEDLAHGRDDFGLYNNIAVNTPSIDHMIRGCYRKLGLIYKPYIAQQPKRKLKMVSSPSEPLQERPPIPRNMQQEQEHLLRLSKPKQLSRISTNIHGSEGQQTPERRRLTLLYNRILSDKPTPSNRATRQPNHHKTFVSHSTLCRLSATKHTATDLQPYSVYNCHDVNMQKRNEIVSTLAVVVLTRPQIQDYLNRLRENRNVRKHLQHTSTAELLAHFAGT